MITTFSLGKERNETLASGRSKNETVTEILEKVGNLKQNPGVSFGLVIGFSSEKCTPRAKNVSRPNLLRQRFVPELTFQQPLNVMTHSYNE
ncbi:MAG: hypothetical protein WAN82_04765 [Candidatus Bathyarchaeia archaeon]|jgi:hypothetical protein